MEGALRCRFVFAPRPRNPQEARATLKATLAIEHSVAVGKLVMLPLASALQ